MTGTRVFSHPLRWVPIASFLPAFILNLVYCILSSNGWLFTGMIMLVASSIINISLLRAKAENQFIRLGPLSILDEGRTGPSVLLLFDGSISITFFTLMMILWLGARQEYNDSLAVLQTYASLPFLASFFLHGYLALLSFGDLVSGGISLRKLFPVRRSCPHCNPSKSSGVGKPMVSSEGAGGAAYACGAAHGEDEDLYQDSFDDDAETTGLLASKTGTDQQPKSEGPILPV